jgi:signal transduction histidine kinase/CheY-like chemotaxis protein
MTMEKINRQNVILQAIKQVHEKAICCETMEELGASCLEIVESITGSSFSFIGEMDEHGQINILAVSDADLERCKMITNLKGSKPPNRQVLHGLYSTVFRSGRSLLTNSPSAQTESIGVPPGDPLLTSFLGVPFLMNSKVIGMVGVGNREGEYRPEDQEMVEALAPTILESILHKRAEIELRQSKEEYRVLVDELNTADRRKNEFLGILSHELRNPLASISLSLGLLDRTDSEGQEAVQAQEIMRRQVGQLTHLIDDLLDVTRISRGRINLQKKVIDLNEMVLRTVNDHGVLYAEKGVTLEFVSESPPVHVEVDEVRLTQIVGNLLNNSLKFTSSGCRIKVIVLEDAEQGEAVVSIEDNGIGITADVLSRLFQPFTQAENSLDRTPGGLGLGLFLVKELIELHGGTVSASSDGVGKGAQFKIRLPISSQREGQNKKAVEPDSGSLRILVIDDIKDVAEVLSALLLHLGHQVAVAYDGTEGFKKARDFGPEAVLCDIGLPGINGYEVARMFRAEDSLKDVFLVSVTGYASPQDIALARDAGFDEHLAKPVDMTVLQQTLNRVKDKSNRAG